MRYLSFHYVICWILLFSFPVLSQACSDPDVSISITRAYSTDPSNENVELWEGEEGTGNLIFIQNGMGYSSQETYNYFCVSRSLLTLVLTSYGNGWATNSRILLRGERDIMIANVTLDSFSRRVYYIDNSWPVLQSTLWSYSDTYTIQWNQISFDSSSWERTSQGGFPDVPSSVITRYYRFSAAVSNSMNRFSGFRFGLNLRFGAVIYINGIEQARFNMPDGEINRYTTPSNIELVHSIHSVSLLLTEELVSATSFVIAVEVHHQSGHATLSDEFFAFFSLLPAEKDRSHLFDNLVVWPPSLITMTDALKIVDDDIRTSVLVSSGDAFKFSLSDNGYFMMNAYTITLVDTQNKPISWKVEGSNDGSSWVVVDARDSTFYFVNQKSERFVLNGQSSIFKLYQVTFITFQSTGSVSLAEIQFQLVPQQLTSTPYLGYSSKAFSLYPGESKILISPLLSGFSSFSIQPSTLPSGVVFSQLSGQFSGSIAPSHPYFNSLYIISGKYQSGQEMVTQVVIQVMECANSYSLLQVQLISKGEGSSISWDLKWNNELIMSRMGNDDETTVTEKKCLLDGHYELTVYNRRKDTWPVGSRVALSMILVDETQLLPLGNCYLSNNQESLTIPLTVALYARGLLTDWMYAYQNVVPENWYAATSTVQWVYSFSGMELSRSIWLFQRSIELTTITTIAVLEFRIYCRAGLVVYMNNQQIYRVNVPDGPLTPTTVATQVLNPYWHVFTAPAANLLNQGSNIISVAAVNSDSNEREVDFKATIVPIAHNNFISRLFTDDSLYINSGSSTSGHPASFLIDSDLSTYYESTFSYSNPPEVSLILQNDRMELFNKYCLTVAHDDYYQPTAWTFEGFINNTWVSVDVVSDSLFSSGEMKCLSISPNAYSQYRLKFTKSMNSRTLIQLTEIGMFYWTFDESSAPILQMSTTDVVAFMDTEFIPEYSVTSGFTNFAVTPSLPAGLFVDKATGLIQGIAEESRLSQVYTLSASFGSAQQFVIFSLRVVECDNPSDSRNILHIAMSDYSTSTIWLILRNETHTIIDDQVGGPSYSRSLCLRQDYYRLLFFYQSSGSPSYTITSQNGTYTGFLDSSKSSFEVIMDTRRLIHPQNTIWHYWISSEAPASNWFQSSVSSEWPVARAGDFPSTTGLTSYFCTTFRATYASYIGAFSLGILTRGGIIAYLNGVEINRVRLPLGQVSHSTPSLNHTATPMYVIFSGSVQFLPFVVDDSVQVEGGAVGDNNRLCIEEHRPTSMMEESTFAAYMEYIQEESSRIVDGWGWGSVEGVGSPWFEYIENAFDGNPNSKYFGHSNCVNVIAQWNYWNDRKEFANYLEFYAGNAANRRPTSLRLEGRLNIGWDILFEVDRLVWNNVNGYGQWKGWMFNNSASYPAYQLVANGCTSEGIEYAEVILKAKRVDVACAAEGEFPAANEGEESRGPCLEYHTGYATRICLNGRFSEIDYSRCVPTAPTSFQYFPERLVCYTHTYIYLAPTEVTFHVDVFAVSPPLPTGVTFNVTSGEIYGVPVVTSLNTYTVTARNTRGNSKTTFFLSVQSGCPSITDFPATPVGEEAVYYCGSSFWVLGSIRRRCEDINGIPTWSLPSGYCQNSILVIVIIILSSIILLIVIGMCYMSSSVAKHTKVYELENGEYELESYDPDDKGAETAQVVRMRPRMKLIGRPVFIYLPRYFPKARRDPSPGYRRMSSKRKTLPRQLKV